MNEIERFAWGQEGMDSFQTDFRETYVRSDDYDALAERTKKLELALARVIACDERDHANPAAYATAMSKVAEAARRLLAAPEAP